MSNQDPHYRAGQQAGQNGGNVPQQSQTGLNSTDYNKMLDGYRNGQGK